MADGEKRRCRERSSVECIRGSDVTGDFVIFFFSVGHDHGLFLRFLRSSGRYHHEMISGNLGHRKPFDCRITSQSVHWDQSS